MRCELAAALIHNPPLFFLDEPTIGLDVLVKLKIRDFLKEINEKYNTTILLTTHDLGDIEALCDRVVMLDNGEIIYDGELQSLKDNWAEDKEVHFQFMKQVNQAELDALSLSFPVAWEYDEKNQTYIAVIKDEGNHISDLISRLFLPFRLRMLKFMKHRLRKLFETYMKRELSNPSKCA